MTGLAYSSQKDHSRPRIQIQLLVCKPAHFLQSCLTSFLPARPEPPPSGHRTLLFSPVSRHPELQGPKEHHGLSTQLGTKPSNHTLFPARSPSCTWKPSKQSTPSHYQFCMSSAFCNFSAGLWDPRLNPSHLLGNTTLVLNTGSRKGPSVPV